MTPAEARLAIEKGFGPKLMKDWLEPCRQLGNIEKIFVLCPASRGYEGCDGPEMPFSAIFVARAWSKGVCTFLEKNKCAIHDSGFKPLQCREALACDDEQNEKCPDNYEMAKLWDTEEGRETVKLWESKPA
jgi:hypothetical protein